MIEEYLGDEETKYTLDSGKEITLSESEFEELCTQNKEFEELKAEAECQRATADATENKNIELEDEIRDLEEENNSLARDIDKSEETIEELKERIEELEDEH